MNSTEVFNAIEEVAAAKPKDKLPLLVKYLADPTFKRVCNAAYNPFITFGQRPGRVSGHGKDGFTDETWKIFGDLANRRLTGNPAKTAMDNTMDQLDAGSAELFWRIVNKDLKAGFSEGTLNKALKGFIPEFPYMRCTLSKDVDFTKWEWEEGVISQVKADGRFTNVNVELDGNVSMTSRQGMPIPVEKFGRIEADLKTYGIRGTQSHGEMLVIGPDGKTLPRAEGNGMINEVVEGGEFAAGYTPILQLWDNIPLTCVVAKGTCETPYAQRLAGIMKAFSACETVKIVETKIVKSLAEAIAHFLDAVARGLEGTVVKRKRGIWKDTGSGGSPDQVKMKVDCDVELKIIGYRDGKEGSKRESSIGALELSSECGLLTVGAGSGLKAADLARFDTQEKRDAELGGIVTIRFNDIMEPSESNELHSLFLPRVIEFRSDKSTADTLEQIKAVFEEAKSGKSLIEGGKKAKK